MSVFPASLRRILFLHAHPDDETLATGAAIATLAGRGVEVAVLTATRGERGEVVPGPLSVLLDRGELPRERERELARALAALGVSEHRYLGATPGEFSDSGMQWGADGRAEPPADAPGNALSTVPLEAVVARVLGIVDELRPELIVSYDAGGGYGHPDHVRCWEAAGAAGALRDLPVVAIVTEDPQPGDTVIAVAPVAGQMRAALNAHRTQLTLSGDVITHSGGQEQEFPVEERYRASGAGVSGEGRGRSTGASA
ncbi:PIG-L deacetylase family protein [Mycetocola spongiae]|uniref:PIG-L deacetylase family protein n=1 Tax=Mycetocola spongiae TaxID=2859226 RepID=UPI001CF46605|nr:PIG-L family deacetylase [Mycetocola spongiae]UCR89378.1 PIG-L family deacetylase [Mycetocola spongiae]